MKLAVAADQWKDRRVQITISVIIKIILQTVIFWRSNLYAEPEAAICVFSCP